MSNTRVAAIETEYNGYMFRSRLEARWAVSFDALGVKYEYEPECFDVGHGYRYLPDFKVKCYGYRGHVGNEPFDLWIEVKEQMDEYDAQKIVRFADRKADRDGNALVVNPILIVGGIPDIDGDDPFDAVEWGNVMDGTNICPFNYELIDGDYFGAFPAGHDGKLYLWGADSNYIKSEDVKIVKAACRVARGARFADYESFSPFIARRLALSIASKL